MPGSRCLGLAVDLGAVGHLDAVSRRRARLAGIALDVGIFVEIAVEYDPRSIAVDQEAVVAAPLADAPIADDILGSISGSPSQMIWPPSRIAMPELTAELPAPPP